MNLKYETKPKSVYAIKGYFGLLLAAAVLLLLGGFFFQQYTSEQKVKKYLQSMVGNAYGNDAEWTPELLNLIFETEISAEHMQAGRQALVVYGYTRDGIEFLMDAQWQVNDYLPLGIFVLLLAGIVFLLWKRERAFKNHVEKLQETIHNQENKIKEINYVETQNKHLQSFIENIAHQIKTPLSRVMSSLDLVLEEFGQEEAMGCESDQRTENVFSVRVQKRIEETFTHLNAIRQLITRLIQIGRMEAGTVLFKKEKMVLEELLYDSWYASVGEIETAEDPMKVQVFSETADTVYYGDYEWLKEAFSNIFTNCVQHDNSGKPIDVTCRKFAEYYMIQIRDHGPGFCKEDIPNLFSRFYTPKSEKQGHVGIGLNLTRLIVEGHKGGIHAANHETGGAVFEILLPIYMLKEEKY